MYSFKHTRRRTTGRVHLYLLRGRERGRRSRFEAEHGPQGVVARPFVEKGEGDMAAPVDPHEVGDELMDPGDELDGIAGLASLWKDEEQHAAGERHRGHGQ